MTKLTKRIGKMWEDKTGVSPIIAVILMVAITVVLAATIYVWVSGFGGGGDETPSMALQADNADNTWTVTSADTGISWDDIEFKISGSTAANMTFCGVTVGSVSADSFTVVTTTFSGADAAVDAGDTFKINSGPTGNVDLTLRYTPTNSVLGTWTLNV